MFLVLPTSYFREKQQRWGNSRFTVGTVKVRICFGRHVAPCDPGDPKFGTEDVMGPLYKYMKQ